jgi:hypothetical protein
VLVERTNSIAAAMIATSLTSIAVAGIGAAVFNHVFRYISYSLSPRGKLPIAVRVLVPLSRFSSI